MATKKQGTIKATKKAVKEQSDLQILSPDREVTIAGKKVLMREYRFVESLRVRVLAQPMIDSMHTLMTAGELTNIEGYLAVFERHQDLVEELIAISCGLSVEEIRELPGNTAMDLIDVWWFVNGPFFTRAVMKKIVQNQITAPVAGQTQHSSSSAAATASTTSSTTTQSDK